MLASSASAGTTRHGISFSNVVKATDFGADPTGSSPSDAAVEAATSEGTLVVFPPGEYHFEKRITWTGLNTLGYYGDGDVRFVPPDGYNDTIMYIRAAEFLFEGIDIDIRAPNTVTGITVDGSKRFVIEDVTQLGRGTHPDSEVQKFLKPIVSATDGVGYIRNVTVEKGSSLGEYKAGKGRSCIFVGAEHVGTLKIQSCHFEEFGNNAIYASKTPGDVHVENCFLRNNNIASVRLGGVGSYVKDTVVEIDINKYTGPTEGLDSKLNMRGIWLEHLNRNYGAGASIQGCSVSVADSRGASAGIVVNNEVGAVSITDTTVQVDADGIAGIIRKSPNDGMSPITLDNVSVVGSGENHLGVMILGTDGSRIQNSCVYLPGDNRNGIRVKDAANCRIEDTNVSVGGEEFVIESADVARSGITNDTSCPLPGTDTSSPDHELKVKSVGGQNWTTYRFETSGSITKLSTADNGDAIEGTTAEGGVGGGGTDAFGFDGDLVDFDITGGSPDDVQVLIDGTEYQLDAGQRIEIRSIGSEEWTKYAFETSGSVTKLSTADDADVVDGTTAQGGLGNGYSDAFRFEGDIVSFDVLEGSSSNIQVLVDGTELSIGDSHQIRIKSVGSKDYVAYAFETTGSIVRQKTADSSDSIEGTTAEGGVGGGGTDAFGFDGDLVDFSVTRGSPSDLSVTVDGNPVDLWNHLRIEGTGDFIGYQFEVSGDVKATKTTDSTDSISGSFVDGSVASPGVDEYRFTGDITQFELTNGTGGVDVYVNGEPYSI
jgi:hypothetical protein